MDFDPHGAKWQCCCCSLPSGLQFLATGEMLLSAVVAAITALHVSRQAESPSWFEICLLMMMVIMAFTSALLIFAIHKHDAKLMYPTLVARGLLIIFVQVFGVSTVVSPQTQHSHRHVSSSAKQDRDFTSGQPNMALRLVLLVFAMLFITLLLFYCIYLVVRGIRFEMAFSRLKERRASLIQAGMIDPDFGSRRPSLA